MTNTGAVTIGANAVTNGKIANDAVTFAKQEQLVQLTGDADITLTDAQAGADVIVDVALTANRVINLPTANLTAGMYFKIVRTDAENFTSTVNAGANTIEGMLNGIWSAAKNPVTCPGFGQGTIEVVYIGTTRWVVRGNAIGYA